MFSRWWQIPLVAVLAILCLTVIPLTLAATLVYPKLPSVEALKDYRPKIPLRVYTADGALIGEFGYERRAFVRINQVPLLMKEAILAAEDDRFYQHHGIDYMGVARAALADLHAGGAREGASTITMQVARNFFLTSEKSLSRKVSEVMMSWKIEHELSKDQILELYINQIYLGQRAYGFQAAAQTYFGKPLSQLNIAEMAILAGLPKAPSAFNPVVNPERSIARQHYVLRRMHELKFITDAQYQQALAQPITVKRTTQQFQVNAPYVAEMVRQAMYEKYGDSIYTSGMKVYTTLKKADQEAADKAVVSGVLAYDRRHGYRGPEGHMDIPDTDANDAMDVKLAALPVIRGMLPAVVLKASPEEVQAYTLDGKTVTLHGAGLEWVHRALSRTAPDNLRIHRGAIIRIRRDDNGDWQVAQLPLAEGVLVSVNPKDGGILALVGGFDFNRNKFNHVTQAWRQPGSSFKPFIYSAALEKGFTPESILQDAPLSLPDGNGGVWQPQNYEGTYDGPITLRKALAESKNLVAIRLLQAIGTQYAQDYVTRFGFAKDKNPAYLTMALGSAEVTPMQMATAYAVFANGGYRVKPYFIDKIVDVRGNVLSQYKPVEAGAGAPRVIDARNAFIMTSMMQDVVKYGTAAAAMKLGRHDLAGKTGTTNDMVDAWFCGYDPKVVAVSWMGFDKPRTLGHGETGAQAALPIWMKFMTQALAGVPDQGYPVPPGVVTAQVNPVTGQHANGGGVTDYFYKEAVPSGTAPAQQPQAQQPSAQAPASGAAPEGAAPAPAPVVPAPAAPAGQAAPGAPAALPPVVPLTPARSY